jgi:hypothetical protein
MVRQCPAPEFAQRNVHHVEEPLEEGGNKFAKGNQMVLVVAVNLWLTRFQPHHRVGIAVAGVAQRDADQRGAVIAGVALLQRVPVTRRQLTRQQGQRGFGGDRQQGTAVSERTAVPA